MRIHNEQLLAEYIEKYNLHKRFSERNLSNFELFQFQKGDMLLHSSVLSEFMFFLLEGSLKVYNYSADGKIIFLSQLEPFEVIGEIASLWGWKATANVEATSKSICAGIYLGEHRENLLNDLLFMRFLCQRIAIKTIASNKHFTSTLLDSTESRLAALIINSSRNSVFTPNLKEWAELLLISYRHLLRTLNKMVEKGLLEKQGKKYIVLDLDTIKIMASTSTET